MNFKSVIAVVFKFIGVILMNMICLMFKYTVLKGKPLFELHKKARK